MLHIIQVKKFNINFKNMFFFVSTDQISFFDKKKDNNEQNHVIFVITPLVSSNSTYLYTAKLSSRDIIMNFV
jgi:hypothetical protein